MASPSDRVRQDVRSPETQEAEDLLRVLVLDKPRFAQLISRMLSPRYEIRTVEFG